VPAHIAAAVHQALHKLPADRFASAAEFAAALENSAFTSTATRSGPSTSTALPSYRRTAIPALAALAILATAFAAWGWLGRRGAPDSVQRDQVTLGALGMFPFQISVGTAISPDGQTIVWGDSIGGVNQLWVKERGQRDPAPLAGTVGATGGVAFSPDGAWIAFTAGSQLRKIPRRGGATSTLSDSAGAGWGTAWLDDGTIAFSGPGPAMLFQVPGAGGRTERVLNMDALNGDGFVRLAPVRGRRAVLIGGVQANFAVGNVWLVDLDRREAHLLVPGASWAEYTPRGELLYVTRTGALLAAPLDLGDYSLGTSMAIEDGLRTTAGVAEAAFGADGTLLYARGGGAAAPASLVWLDRRGDARPVEEGFSLAGVPLNGGMRLSPDGSRLAYSTVGEAGSTGQDLYVKRLPSGPAARLTFGGGSNRRPTWSPDGTRLLFISDRTGRDAVWSQRADGVGTATTVVQAEMSIFEALWSPDGKWLVYRTDDDAGAGRGDIFGIRLQGDTTPVPFVATPAEETGPAISHDSRWLAYAADETGRKEIYVRPFPNTDDGKWLVSSNGGSEPAWSRSGRELFYRDGGGNLIAVSFAVSGGSFDVVEQTPLFGAQTYWAQDDHRWYDVTPDGQRFIMIDPGFAGGSTNLVKVTGLHSELRKR
jgi:serine/threonine-protein kinase